MKWWDPHTKKLKCFPYAKNDKHNNIFGKGWPSGSTLMNGTNTSNLPMIKIDLSDHPFIKYDILPAVIKKCPSFFGFRRKLTCTKTDQSTDKASKHNGSRIQYFTGICYSFLSSLLVWPP